MKKSLLFLIVAVLLSCASNNEKPAAKKNDLGIIKLEREVPKEATKAIHDAVKNAPSDVLVGVGSYNSSNTQMAMTMAETRARVDIAQQMNKVTTEIVRYYSVKSGIDPADEVIFKETITVSLTNAELIGSKPIMRDVDKEGNWWVVVTMDKSKIIENLSGVQDEARHAVPSMASFNAADLVNETIK